MLHTQLANDDAFHDLRTNLYWRSWNSADNYGVSPSLDAAPNRLPVLTIVTVLAFPRCEPFFASVPTTSISSPSFIVVRVQPRPWRPCGGPISHPQFST